MDTPRANAHYEAASVSPAASGESDGSVRRGKGRFSAGQLLGATLFAVTLIFIFENMRSVRVRLLVPEVSAPLALPIVIATVLGAGIAWLLRYRRNRRRTR